MPLSFYQSLRETTTGNLSLDWKDDFQAFVDEEFENASDYYVVKKQNELKEMVDIGVRLVSLKNLTSSTMISDDYFKMIFKRYDDVTYLGDIYYFNGYWWIVTDTNIENSSSNSCLVQRCADYLRFYDSEGVYHELPSVVQNGSFYDLKKDTHVIIPDNQLRVLVKYNEESKLVKWADVDSSDDKFTRFILEGYAYRVVSIDRHSFVRLGVGYLDVRLQADQISPNDDLINNIADANTNVSIEIQNGDTLTIGESQTIQLNAIVTVDGVELNNPEITYASSDENIATVDSNGLITTIASGSATIIAEYSTASNSIDITVDIASANNYTIDISSSNNNTDSIKLGQTLTYTSVSLNNGEEYPTAGTWELFEDDGVTPLSTDIISVISSTNNTIAIKCTSNFDYVDTVFKLRYTDVNTSNELDITIESLF